MATPKVDLLLDMKNLMAAYATALSGEWDEKIASINKSIEEANTIWDQVSEGQSFAKLKENAQVVADNITASAQAQLDKAYSISEEADKIKKIALALQEEVTKKQAELEFNIQEHASIVATQEAARIKLETSLVDREEAVSAREQTISAKESDLAAREVDLTNTLKQLKDIVD